MVHRCGSNVFADLISLTSILKTNFKFCFIWFNTVIPSYDFEYNSQHEMLNSPAKIFLQKPIWKKAAIYIEASWGRVDSSSFKSWFPIFEWGHNGSSNFYIETYQVKSLTNSQKPIGQKAVSYVKAFSKRVDWNMFKSWWGGWGHNGSQILHRNI